MINKTKSFLTLLTTSSIFTTLLKNYIAESNTLQKKSNILHDEQLRDAISLPIIISHDM